VNPVCRLNTVVSRLWVTNPASTATPTAAKWALALRMQDGTVDADIERAFNEGRILRTHVMRPTWHFVTQSDIRWLLELTAPRVQRVMSSYNRRLELDLRTLTRGTTVIERALRGHRYLTRTELGERLQRAGLRSQASGSRTWSCTPSSNVSSAAALAAASR
jgi:Winged helix DNA-binding domain